MAKGTLHRQRGAAYITEMSAGRVTVPARRHEPVRNATVFFVHGRDPPLARFHEETRPPVLAPAPFALLGTLRPLFSVAQDGDAARLNTPSHQVVHRGLRPLLPQIDVELILPARGPSMVAVPLDKDEKLWMGAQPRGVRVQDLQVARSDCRRAEFEVNVPQRRVRLVVADPRQSDGLVSGWRSRGGGGSRMRAR